MMSLKNMTSSQQPYQQLKARIKGVFKKLLTLFNNEKKNLIFNKDRQYYGEGMLKFLVLTFH